MSAILLAVREFGLALGTLFPIVNPLGSALLFFGLVGLEPPQVYRALARKISASTVAFLLIVEFAGSAVLAFLNISLPVVQLAGGLVLAAMGWNVLNAKDAEATSSGRMSPPTRDRSDHWLRRCSIPSRFRSPRDPARSS